MFVSCTLEANDDQAALAVDIRTRRRSTVAGRAGRKSRDKM
jgi:hypothetical protein